jgi:hypothetical protein
MCAAVRHTYTGTALPPICFGHIDGTDARNAQPFGTWGYPFPDQHSQDILHLIKEVTHILSVIDQGVPHAAEQLLSLVYDELRRLAAAQMACEKSVQTLDATALVHEASLRLVGPADDRRWENRGHFFAAAEAMRRILIENARRGPRWATAVPDAEVLSDAERLGEHPDRRPVTS